MKITVAFKTPDAVDYAIEDAANCDEELQAIEDADELVDKELEFKEDLREALSKWVKYGEYVNIEFDTEAGTATVLPAGG